MATERQQPCPSCPWRVDQEAGSIPNFRLELAEGLANTSRQGGYGPAFGAPMFACHHSRPGDEIVCRGWLAVEGHSHPSVRLAVLRGEYDPEALRPGKGWPRLHRDFGELIEKLRRTA
jgi:Family of unknown function (DUF6283)